MDRPFFSIIVPVYKVEKYIRECIESILYQTFSDWELILVDDGTPDNSGRICDEYAAKDSRIHVYHKDNRGVSSARNLGLDNAHGEWVTFVDSDDRLELNALSSISDCLKKNDADLIQFKSDRTDIEYNGDYDTVLDFSRYVIYEYPVTVWGSVFKTSIINKRYIRFRDNIKL